MNLLLSIETELRLRQSGWWDRLCETIPELLAMSGTPQPPEYHAEGDVAVHTRLAIEACPDDCGPDDCGPDDCGPDDCGPDDCGPDDCGPDLLWVALLHDIGKPVTTEQRADGRVTAYGHAKLGAEMADKILARLGMPEPRRERIVWAIRHHTFHHSWQLETADEITRRQRRYLDDARFPLLLEFLRIDSLASQGNPRGMQTYEFYRELWQTCKS